MKIAWMLLWVLLASLLPAAGQQGKSRRSGPEVTLLELQSHRESGRIMIDGRVKVTSDRPIKGVVLLFDLMASGNQVISTQKIVVAEETVEPGHEAEFGGHVVDHARAIRIRVHCEDRDTRHLRVANAGPFPIE